MSSLASWERDMENILKVFNGLKIWSETPAEETPVFTVTADGEQYTLDNRGEMVDRFGRGTGIKVDTANNRVYDEHDNFIGYFDSNGDYRKL